MAGNCGKMCLWACTSLPAETHRTCKDLTGAIVRNSIIIIIKKNNNVKESNFNAKR